MNLSNLRLLLKKNIRSFGFKVSHKLSGSLIVCGLILQGISAHGIAATTDNVRYCGLTTPDRVFTDMITLDEFHPRDAPVIWIKVDGVGDGDLFHLKTISGQTYAFKSLLAETYLKYLEVKNENLVTRRAFDENDILLLTQKSNWQSLVPVRFKQIQDALVFEGEIIGLKDLDLHGKNFANQDLRYQFFGNANLQGTNFRKFWP